MATGHGNCGSRVSEARKILPGNAENNQRTVEASPTALTEYGHLLETFAVGEILKQASWSDAPVAVGHFRTEAGEEVDLVLERDDGQVIAVEVKAGSRISGEDFRGLRQLKERLGSRLEDAIILHTGEHAYMHDDWITVLPLDRLWAEAGSNRQPRSQEPAHAADHECC